MLRRPVTWAIASLSLLIGLGIAVGEAQRQMPDGVPPKGSGPVEVTNVRVVDGDSIDAYVDGKRTAIGLIGVDAPSHNTDCGKQATGMMWGLVKGGLRLEDDPDQTLDERKRRMYRAKMADGRSIEDALVQAGVARVTGLGARKLELATAEAEARTEQRGCAWGGAPASPQNQPAPAGANQSPVASALDLIGTLGFGSIVQPAVASAAPLAAPAYPSGFQHDQVVSGLQQPTNIDFGPGGRMFIAQQNGVVRLYKNGALLPTPVIDISDRVNDHWDHGLLGMAVDPNFSQNGFLYLLYTHETNAGNYEGKKVGRVARYTVVNDVANPNTELVLLGTQSSLNDGCENMPVTADCIPSEGLSHSVGALEFADDGTLFLTTGDAASFNVVDDLALRAQNIDSLGGKVLRINVNGQGLADNPYYNGSVTANRSKVWARGVRNAYRFNIKPSSRVPYLGDVGWNSTEEVSAATRGANLGWPCYEGNAQQTGYASKSVCQTLYGQGDAAHQGPIIDWGHNFGGTCCGAAATGGTFLQGTAYPAQYQGAYFYADFAKGFIRYLRTDDVDEFVPGSDQPFATATDGPVDIELGPDQNLYYVAINTGHVRRIRYIGAGNRPPVAELTATPTEGLAPLAVLFSSAGTLDQDADTLTYSWNFGDGTTSTQANPPTKTYSSNGTYNVVLTVNDGRGGSDTATTTITVGNRRPTATITSPNASLTYKVGDTISLTGSATDPDPGNTTTLTWQVNAKHCPGGQCHTHPPLFTGTGASQSFAVPDHGDENHFEITLTATDNGGLTDTKTVLIQPQTVQLSFASTPTDRQIIYDGTQSTTPFTKTTVPNSQHTIEPGLNTGYQFTSWSDGGAAQHNITVPLTNSTITATFTQIPTVTFDDKSGQDQPLNGQYPTNVINWNSGIWYHSGPWGPLTTKSMSFLGASQTTGSFTFVTPRKLVSLRAYNGGGSSNTVTLSCAGQTNKTQAISAGQVVTISTGWTGACSTVTIQSPNGWNTNFDDLVHDAGATPPGDTTPPVVSGAAAGSVTATGATITWTTNEAADRQVAYGTTTSYGSLAPTTPGTPLGTSHSVTLSGLAPSTTYNYQVRSRDAAGNLGQSGNLTFTTAAAPPDTTPPTVSGTAAGSVTNNSAVITWTTNEAADRQVAYGTTTAYGSLAPATPGTPLGTSHSVTLTGLAASTTYNYKVMSKDAAGNLGQSGNLTFTTTATPPPTTTITFNDKTGQDQPLTGEYPTGVINWGPDGWYHSGPWGQFTTKSVSFGGPGDTSKTFTFVTAKRLVSVRVYNGGGSSTTISISCNGQTKTQAVSGGQVATITTGFANTCTSVTVGSTNGWDSNFDDLVYAN